MPRLLTIDAETGDRITIDTLKFVIEEMQQDIETIMEEMKQGTDHSGHAKDLIYNLKFIEAAKVILKYYEETYE